MKSREYIVEKLTELEHVIGGFNKELDRLCTVFTALFECEAVERAWVMMDAYVKAVAELTGIEAETLMWWVYECRLGEKPMICITAEGEHITCNSLDAFLSTLGLED